MIRLLKHIFLGLLIALILPGCSSKNKMAKSEGTQSQFAFIEFFQTSEGKVLQGKVPSGRRIDSPTYSFNKDTRDLQVFRSNDFAVDSLVAVLGTGKILKGAAGSGVSSLLIGVNKLPFSYSDFEILKIDSKSASVRYKSENITLQIGQEWTQLKTQTDTIKLEEVSVVEILSTTRIQFHGFLPDSLITRK